MAKKTYEDHITEWNENNEIIVAEGNQTKPFTEYLSNRVFMKSISKGDAKKMLERYNSEQSETQPETKQDENVETDNKSETEDQEIDDPVIQSEKYSVNNVYLQMTADELVEEAKKYKKPEERPTELVIAIWMMMYALIDNMFRITEDPRKGIRIYRITKGHQVAHILNDEDLFISRAIKKNKDLSNLMSVVGVSSKRLINGWMHKTEAIEVTPYTVGDQNKWTLFIGMTPNEEVSTMLETNENTVEEILSVIPHWSDFLSRLSDPTAFMLWIYGAYSGEYNGRRAMWLYSADPTSAEEGKSTVSSVIGLELFGHIIDGDSKIPSGAYTVYSRNAFKRGSQFAWSAHEAAKFTVYPDCKDLMFPLYEEFRNFNSGGRDPVLMEYKNKTAYGTTINTRLLIHSNSAPTLKGERAITSRILPITVAPWNLDKMGAIPSFKLAEHLTGELPIFLSVAKHLWRQHQDVILSERTEALIEQLVDDANEHYQNEFYKHFIVSDHPDSFVEAGDVYELMNINSKDRFATMDLANWLKTLGVKKEKTRRGGGGQIMKFFGMNHSTQSAQVGAKKERKKRTANELKQFNQNKVNNNDD